MDFSLCKEFFELLKFAKRCGKMRVVLDLSNSGTVHDVFIRSLETQALFLKEYGGDLKLVVKSEHIKNCIRLHSPFGELDVCETETQALDRFAMEMK